MTAAIQERVISRSGMEGWQNAEAHINYLVTGSDDDAAVRTLVASTYPNPYLGLLFQNYTIENEKSSDRWAVVVNYGKPAARTTGFNVLNFDTGGGTQRITNSIATVNSYAASGSAPDYKGAIGVTGGGTPNVEGVDIHVPVYTWSETWYLATSGVDTAYQLALFGVTGKTNSGSFRGFDPGEVLFLGASGSLRNNDDYEITFKFAASPNLTGISVGDITGIAKNGWDYLWVKYKDDVSGTSLIRIPQFAYVEQVYYPTSFTAIGIGS